MYVTADVDLNLICVDCGRMLSFVQALSPSAPRTILWVKTCPCAGKAGARPGPTINETLGEIAAALDHAGVDVQKTEHVYGLRELRQAMHGLHGG